MAKIIKAPEKNAIPNINSVFLAGSIDMGKAVNWQTEIENLLGFAKDITIFNPRRDDWDASWVQDISNDQFREQVEWELTNLERASLIIVYFDPSGAAPITLLELGLFHDKNVIVCCPEGYWRRGNVEIVCNRYNIPFLDTLDQLQEWVFDWAIERSPYPS